MTSTKRMMLLGTALAAAATWGASAEVVFRATPQIVEPAPQGGGTPPAAGGQNATPAPASLAASPGSIDDFVVTAPGTTPASRSVRITNGGGSPSVVPVPTLTGPFTVSSDGCGAPLAAGASCDIAIAPYATADGAFSGSLSVAGVSSPVALSGTASGFVSVVSSTPTAAQTSNVVGGASPSGAPAVFTVRNSGAVASGAVSVALTSGGSDFVLGGTCGTTVLSLAAGGTASCTVTVARTATANDAVGKTAELKVSFAAGGSSTHSVSGTAAGFAAVLSHASGTLAAGGITTAAATGACTDLRISNTGNTAGGASASVSFSGTGASSFQTCATTNQPCSASPIAAGSFCNLGVQLKSSSVNATYAATATVTASGLSAGGRSITGTVSGLAPVLSMAATSLAATAINVTSPGNCTAVSVSNTGSALLSLPTLSFTGTNPNSFQSCTMTTNSCTSGGIQPGASCDLGFQLVSTINGSFTATMTAAANGQSTIRTVTGSAANTPCRTRGNTCPDGSTYMGIGNGSHYYLHPNEVYGSQASIATACPAGYRPFGGLEFLNNSYNLYLGPKSAPNRLYWTTDTNRIAYLYTQAIDDNSATTLKFAGNPGQPSQPATTATNYAKCIRTE